MASQKTGKRPTQDHLRKKVKATTTVPLYTDDEAVAAVEALEQKIRMSQSDTERRKLQTELDKAIAERDSSMIELRFQACGRKQYHRLVDSHPPTDEQVKEYQEANATPDPDDPSKTRPGTGRPDYNPETFPAALIHATLKTPAFDTVEDLEEALEDWNETEYLQLWMAAVRVCNMSRVGHWGKG